MSKSSVFSSFDQWFWPRWASGWQARVKKYVFPPKYRFDDVFKSRFWLAQLKLLKAQPLLYVSRLVMPLLLITGVIVSLYLVKINQDIRQRATVDTDQTQQQSTQLSQPEQPVQLEPAISVPEPVCPVLTFFTNGVCQCDSGRGSFPPASRKSPAEVSAICRGNICPNNTHLAEDGLNCRCNSNGEPVPIDASPDAVNSSCGLRSNKSAQPLTCDETGRKPGDVFEPVSYCGSADNPGVCGENNQLVHAYGPDCEPINLCRACIYQRSCWYQEQIYTPGDHCLPGDTSRLFCSGGLTTVYNCSQDGQVCNNGVCAPPPQQSSLIGTMAQSVISILPIPMPVQNGIIKIMIGHETN